MTSHKSEGSCAERSDPESTHSHSETPVPDERAASLVYDSEYYRSGCGDIPYERNEHWLRFFHGIADQIVRSLNPRRVLDAGCAKGFLVEALWERGVEAWGIDISEYAIGEVRMDMRPYCRQASLTEPIEGRFDLAVCIEVLEHIPAAESRLVIENLTNAADTILFSSTSTDFNEPTHVNVRPTIVWLREFAEAGFAPELLYDATFVAPHAFLLRRTSQRLPDEVLVLFSQMLRYRLVLADRARVIEHLSNETKRLQAGQDAAQTEVATLNDQLHLLRTEAHHREVELGARAAEIQRLNQDIQTLTGERHAAEMAEANRRAAAAEAARQETLSALGVYIDSLTARADSAASRLEVMESKVAEVGRQTTDILQSRIWRTLRAGGGILLSPFSAFRPAAPTPAAQFPQPPGSGDDFYGLFCDEPRANGSHPVTGKIAVSGWALARSGVDRIEIGFPGLVSVATTGRARPDVGRGYPDVLSARTSGFTAEIDTSSLSSGLHILTVKAFSGSGATREIRLPVRIDHETGYASDYDRWIAEFETRNEPLIQLRLRIFTEKPLVSILTPVYRTPPGILRQTIESVIAQTYPNWELCLVDDGSGSKELEQMLEAYARKDSRIKVAALGSNAGISRASQAALEMATGAFVALLDHDDELAGDALYHVVEALNLRREADLFYSDEDKIDEEGRRYDPFFKPDWSPDLLLSENYLCHFLVIRRSVLNEAGGFRTGFEGSQDYDLVLRVTGRSARIVHIPRVLYHWRSLPTSTAASPDRKDYAAGAAERAIQEELDRRGSGARVTPGGIPGRWRVRYPLASAPRVSIIIASGGKVEVLRNNLSSLFAKTEYQTWEVLVIDNSRHGDIRRLVENWPAPPRPLRYVDWRDKPFNYSEINNEASRHCDSPILLFLNDDTSVIAPGWLDAMVELAARPEVGAVGAKLLYPDGRIQHAGVVMGLFENCGHAFKGLDGSRQHYFDLPDVIRNVSAVTGACLMVRREVFDEVGGFDEQAFAVAFNDIDLCLKIGAKGYRLLYTPHALLYHHEAFSKTEKDLIPHPAEVRAMQDKWKDVIAGDPFYSPNLTRTAEDYSLRRKT